MGLSTQVGSPMCFCAVRSAPAVPGESAGRERNGRRRPGRRRGHRRQLRGPWEEDGPSRSECAVRRPEGRPAKRKIGQRCRGGGWHRRQLRRLGRRWPAQRETSGRQTDTRPPAGIRKVGDGAWEEDGTVASSAGPGRRMGRRDLGLCPGDPKARPQGGRLGGRAWEEDGTAAICAGLGGDGRRKGMFRSTGAVSAARRT